MKGPGFDPRHLHLIFFHYIFFPLQRSCLSLSLSFSLFLSLKAEQFLWKPKVCKNRYSFVCALTSLTVLQWQVTVMQYIIQNNKNHWNHIPKTPFSWKKSFKKKKKKKKGHFAHIGNEIKICSQNKFHHHLSNVCENSFRMFHSNWVISDYHSFVWQFEFPWLNLTNCPNKWMVIRNDPVTVKHTKWIFTDVGKVMMAFILATDLISLPFFFSFFFEAFFTPVAFLEYDFLTPNPRLFCSHSFTYWVCDIH